MSKVVDERVVVLNFDNKKFEKGTKQTMKSLKQLKKEMQFEEVSDSINKAYDDTDPSKVIKGIDKVNKKITATEVAMITAINRITNKAMDAGEKLVKSLSVDRVIDGWRAYEEEVKSVGTLLGQGYNEAVVNEQLALLSKYSEATSYSYADMANNISKFTAAGVGLEDATQAIMGIANWAALSGQNAQKASQAMYQLSQAIGAGTVKLQDWKSIQNVSMDTQEFRQHVLDTAVAMGTLKKNADGTYKTLSGKSFNIKQFTTQLSEGWFTSDVLVTTLQDYSGAVKDIMDLQDKFDGSAAAAVKEYEKMIADRKKNAQSLGDVSEATTKEIEKMEFALKAFKSAQEARTFTDAINATKDAVTSQWRQTFTEIFGEYNEAKKTWTQLSDDLWNIFAAGGKRRNELLKAWGGKNLVANADAAAEELKTLSESLGLEGSALNKDRWNAFYQAVEGTDELKKAIISAAKEAGTLYEDEEGILHAVDGTVVSLEDFDKSLESGWLTAEALKGTLEDVKNSPLNGREDLFGIDEIKYVDEQGRELTKISYATSGALVNLMKVLTAFRDTVSKAWNDTFGISAETLKRVTERIRDFSRRLSAMVNEDGYFSRLYNIMRGIFSIGKVVVKMFNGLMIALKPITSVFTKGGNSIISIIEKLALKITNFADTTTKFEDAGKKVAVYTQKVADVLLKIFGKISEWVAAAMPTIEKVLHILWNGIKAVAGLLVIVIQRIYEFAKNTVIAIKNSELFQKAIHKVGEVIKKVYEKTKDIFGKFKEWVTTVNKTKFAETIKKLCKSIGDAFAKMFNKIKTARSGEESNNGTLGFLDKVKEKLKVLEPLMTGLKNLWTGIKNIFGPLIRLVGAALTALGDFLTAIGERINGFLDGKNGLISFGELLKTLFKVGIATILTTWVTHIIKSISKLVDALSMFMTGMKGHSILERTAQAIKEFAVAMLMFTAAILILSKIKSDQVSKAMASIAAILAMYVGFIMAIKKLFVNTERISEGFSLFKKGEGAFNNRGKYSSGPAETINAIGMLLVSMSASMLIISMAIKKLSTIDETKTNQALTILVAVMGMLSVFLQQLKSFIRDKGMKVAAPGIMTFIGLAILIKTLAKVMVDLGDMDEQKLVKGTVAVMALCTGLSIVIKSLAKLSGTVTKSKDSVGSDKLTTKSGSLTAMIGVLLSLTNLFNKLSKIMKEMSGISSKDFIKGAAGLGTMAVSLMLVLHSISGLDKQNTKNAKKLVGVLLSMTLVFSAMTWLLKDLSSMEENQFKQAMIAMSAIMGFVLALIATMQIISLFEKDKTINENVDIKKKSVTKFKGIFAALLGLTAVVLAATLMISVATKKIQNGLQLAATISILATITVITAALVAGAVLISKQAGKIKDNSNQMKAIGKLIRSISVMLLAVVASILLIHSAISSAKNPRRMALSIITVFGAIVAIMASVLILANQTGDLPQDKVNNLIKVMDAVKNLLFSISVMLLAMTALSYGKSLLSSAGTILGTMLVIIGSIWAITKISAKLDVTKVNAISTLLISVAASVRIMVAVTKQMSKINAKSMAKLAVISAILLAFVGLAAMISAAKLDIGLIAVAAAVAMFAAAIWLAVDALEKMVYVANMLMESNFDADTIANSLMQIAAAFKKAGNAIGDAIGAIIMGILESLWNNITGFVDKVMTYLSSLTYKLGKIVAELIGGIFAGLAETDAMGSFVDLVLDMIKVLLERLPEIVQQLIDTALQLIDILITRVPDIAVKLSTLAFEIAINFLDAFADQLDKNSGRLADAIHKLFESIVNFFKKLFGFGNSDDSPSEKFKTWGKGVVNGFLDGIKNFKDDVVGFFSKKWEEFSGWWNRTIVEPFTNFGKNVIGGFVAGLTEKYNEVTQWFSDMGNNIKNTFCNIFGIHSPSRVFKEYGEFIDEGLAEGIADDKGVADAVHGLGDTVKDEFEDSDINAIMMAQLDNLNLNDDALVIRPILDLSNIQNGASKIDDIMRSFNGYTVHGIGDMASGVASSMNKDNTDVNRRTGNVNNTTNNDNQYITINVTGTNAQEIADEVSKELQKRVNRRDRVWQ